MLREDEALTISSQSPLISQEHVRHLDRISLGAVIPTQAFPDIFAFYAFHPARQILHNILFNPPEAVDDLVFERFGRWRGNESRQWTENRGWWREGLKVARKVCGEEWMLEDFGDCNALDWIYGEHAVDNGLCVRRQVRRHVIYALCDTVRIQMPLCTLWWPLTTNLRKERLHIVIFEG